MYLLDKVLIGSHIVTLALNVERLWLNVSTSDDR